MEDVVTLRSACNELAYMDCSDPDEVGYTVESVLRLLEDVISMLTIQAEEASLVTTLVDPYMEND